MPLKFRTMISFVFILVGINLSGAVFAGDFVVFTGQVNANSINLRADSTVGAEVICVLPKGELIEVVGEVYDWYKIRLPKVAPSYIKKNLLECNNLNTDFAVASDRCLSAKVIKDRVNIRLAPSESSWILGKVDKSTVVNVIADEGEWYKIHPVFQSYGWVNKKFVNKEIIAFEKQDSAKAVDFIKSGDQLVIEGEVSPYGVVLWRKATHKLITPENKVYFLKGDRKGLDSLNYRKVKITGRLISPAKSKNPILQIDIIEALN